MRKTVVGVVATYGDAERIVRELELEGIVGHQVEVISGVDEEVTGTAYDTDDEAHKPKERIGERIANFFRSHRGSNEQKVHDYYVEDPEFYASQIREGRAMIIVRVPDEAEVNRAAELLRANGTWDLNGKEGVEILEQNDRPELTPPRKAGAKESTMGDPAVTTGGTRADLEGRGQTLRKPA